MKRKQLKKYFVKDIESHSIKQRPQTYHNLPRRTKLASIRYVDSQLGTSYNKKIRKK